MKRRTPLRRTTRLVARTPIKRGNTKLGIRRPKTWTAQEKKDRKLVDVRSGEWCELRIPGVCLGLATNKQHRLAEAHGGPTVPSNLLDVCGMGNVTGCHGYIHQNPIVAVKNGWTVKSGGDFRSTPVLMFDGRVLLDDNGGRLDPPQHKEAS